MKRGITVSVDLEAGVGFEVCCLGLGAAQILVGRAAQKWEPIAEIGGAFEMVADECVDVIERQDVVAPRIPCEPAVEDREDVRQFSLARGDNDLPAIAHSRQAIIPA